MSLFLVSESIGKILGFTLVLNSPRARERREGRENYPLFRDVYKGDAHSE